VFTGAIRLVFGIVPFIVSCWPFGRVICEAQTVLLTALHQHYPLMIIAMAIDRYLSVDSTVQYIKTCSSRLIGLMILSSFLGCVIVTSLSVIPTKEYFFDEQGSKVCAPFFASQNVKILTVCVYFFVPTMSLMYCYGSVFHSQDSPPTGNHGEKKIPPLADFEDEDAVIRRHLSGSTNTSNCTSNSNNSHKSTSLVVNSNGVHISSSGVAGNASRSCELLAPPTQISVGHHRHPGKSNGVRKSSHPMTTQTINNMVLNPDTNLTIVRKDQEPKRLACRSLIEFERRVHYSISRTMAAISLTFIILITPWTFKEVIEACTGTKVSSGVDFLFTVVGGCYHALNPAVYYYFNKNFRKATKSYFREEVLCRRSSSIHGRCCPGHDGLGADPRQGVSALMGQIKPILPMMTPREAAAILAVGTEDSDAVDQLAECGTQTPSLGHHKKHSNSHTAVNKTCKGASNSEDYWGEILEKSMSLGSLTPAKPTKFSATHGRII